MKKVMMTIGLLATTAINANAQDKLEFIATDNSLESDICIAAGKYGMNEARNVIRKNRLDFYKVQATLSCNGMSITKFSRKYNDNVASDVSKSHTIETTGSRSVVLVARPNNKTANLCVDAVVIGEQAAREKYDMPETPITCNNKPLSKFVETYAMATLVSSNDQFGNQ